MCSNLFNCILFKPSLYYFFTSSVFITSFLNYQQVCRGFYLLANDNSIWRDICFKLWPVWLTYDNNNIGCNNQLNYLSSMNYTSWREMAIYRPQVLYHGMICLSGVFRFLFELDLAYINLTYITSIEHLPDPNIIVQHF